MHGFLASPPSSPPSVDEISSFLSSLGPPEIREALAKMAHPAPSPHGPKHSDLMEAVKELAYPTVLIRGAPHGSSSDQLRLALKPLNFSPTQISKQTKNGSFMINLPQAEALALVKTDKGSLPRIQNFILTPLLSNLGQYRFL